MRATRTWLVCVCPPQALCPVLVCCVLAASAGCDSSPREHVSQAEAREPPRALEAADADGADGGQTQSEPARSGIPAAGSMTVGTAPVIAPAQNMGMSADAGPTAGNQPGAPVLPSPPVLVTLDEDVPDHCQFGDPVPLALRWVQGRLATLEPRVSCTQGNRCELSFFEIAAAPDGSLWVAALAVTPGSDWSLGLWLLHHGPDGERLSARLVQSNEDRFSTDYHFKVVADERGHAFLGVTEYEGSPSNNDATARASWLEEYGPDGERVGERTALDSQPATRETLLAVTDDNAIAAGHLMRKPVSVLNPDRTPRWQHDRAGLPEVHALVADARGRVGVLAFSGVDGFAGAQDLRIEQYEKDGTLAQDYRVPRSSRYVALGSDYDGNLIQIGYNGSEGQPLELWIRKLRAQGGLAWSTRLTVPAGFIEMSELGRLGTLPNRVVGDGQGTLFITGGATEEDDTFYVNLYEVAADGASCRLHRLRFEGDGYNDLDALAVNRDGRLFFSTRNAYGEFEH